MLKLAKKFFQLLHHSCTTNAPSSIFCRITGSCRAEAPQNASPHPSHSCILPLGPRRVTSSKPTPGRTLNCRYFVEILNFKKINSNTVKCRLLISQIQTATWGPWARKGWKETRKGIKQHDKDPELFTHAWKQRLVFSSSAWRKKTELKTSYCQSNCK